MTQIRIGIAIVVAGLLGGPATVLAQTPAPEEAPPEETPADEPPAEEAPVETPVVVSEPEPVEAVTEEAESASFGYD
jgi:hypothetical protein